MERIITSQDWIYWFLGLCFVLIAFSKVISRIPLNELLSASLSDRFIKITSSNRESFTILKVSNLIIYSICIAILIYGILQQNNFMPLGINKYLMILLATSVFLLIKHYIGKVVSSLIGFDSELDHIDFHRNIYRSFLSYLLFVGSTLLVTTFEFDIKAALYIAVVCMVILGVYNSLLLYSHRTYIYSHLFYFILYLCTLEIAPYLLLYKLFKS